MIECGIGVIFLFPPGICLEHLFTHPSVMIHDDWPDRDWLFDAHERPDQPASQPSQATAVAYKQPSQFSSNCNQSCHCRKNY